MVLYVPGLVSSACSWAHCCKHRKAEGRQAIVLRKSNLLVVHYAHVLRSSLTQNRLSFCRERFMESLVQ